MSVYVLRCADSTLYIGHAHDLAAREQMHNSGRGAAYTAVRRPVRIIYSESYDSLEQAIRRERQLKRWTTEKKDALVAGDRALEGSEQSSHKSEAALIIPARSCTFGRSETRARWRASDTSSTLSERSEAKALPMFVYVLRCTDGILKDCTQTSTSGVHITRSAISA